MRQTTETMSSPRKAIGIMGGTFDPIHFAHLRLALEAHQHFDLQRVVLIPAGQPKHRDQPATPAQDRLAMTELAAASVAELCVDSTEVFSDQPSFTVLTLERLRKELGREQPLVLLLGVDAFLGLARWHRWAALFALAHIAIATRPGYVLSSEAMDSALRAEFETRFTQDMALLHAQPAGKIYTFNMTPLTISATAIRALLAQGKSPKFLLPDTVLTYIQEKNLYANAS